MKFSPLSAYFTAPAALVANAAQAPIETPRALYDAIVAGASEERIIELLHRAGAELEERDKDGHTPLIRAAKEGNLEAIRALEKLGANMLVQDKKGRRIDQIAEDYGATQATLDGIAFLLAKAHMKNDDVAALSDLIAGGLSLYSLDEKDYSLLTYAIFHEADACTLHLLQRGAPLEERTIPALFLALSKNNAGLMRYLYNEGITLPSEAYLFAFQMNLPAKHFSKELFTLVIQKMTDAAQKDSLLHSAAYAGNEQLFRHFIELGVPLKKDGKIAPQLLAAAVSGGNTSLVDYLISQGADTKTLRTLLDNAIYDDEMIQKILKLGADVNAKNIYNSTALHRAIQQKNALPRVKILVEAGADVNALERDGLEAPPLFYLGNSEAEPSEYLPLLRYLASKGANLKLLDRGGDSLLHKMASCAPPEALRYLHEQGLDINARNEHGRTPLNCSSSFFPTNLNMQKESIACLLELGASMSQKDANELLHDAAFGKNQQLVELLLSKGADINSASSLGQTALIQALKRCDNYCLPSVKHDSKFSPEFIAYLIAQGADVNQTPSDFSPLHWAIHAGRGLEVVRLLVEKGANIHARYKGDTPLATCFEHRGNLPIARYLMNRGARLEDARQGNEEEQSLLHDAARANDAEAVDFLIERGYDINARNSEGETPIARCPDYTLDANSSFSLLVQRGANTKLADGRGELPVHRVARNGSFSLFKRLVNKENVNTPNKEGFSPYLLAIAAGNTAKITHMQIFCEPNTQLKTKDGRGILEIAQENHLPLSIYPLIGIPSPECEKRGWVAKIYLPFQLAAPQELAAQAQQAGYPYETELMFALWCKATNAQQQKLYWELGAQKHANWVAHMQSRATPTPVSINYEQIAKDIPAKAHHEGFRLNRAFSPEQRELISKLRREIDANMANAPDSLRAALRQLDELSCVFIEDIERWWHLSKNPLSRAYLLSYHRARFSPDFGFKSQFTHLSKRFAEAERAQREAEIDAVDKAANALDGVHLFAEQAEQLPAILRASEKVQAALAAGTRPRITVSMGKASSWDAKKKILKYAKAAGCEVRRIRGVTSSLPGYFDVYVAP